MKTHCPSCGHAFETQVAPGLQASCPRCMAAFLAAGEEASLSGSLLKPGEILGGCLIERVLGQGGMGTVYLATQQSLGRKVALKVLSERISENPAFVRRFDREAAALATLSHPNIVSIIDRGVQDGRYYLVMEYVDGVNLREVLSSRKLDPAQALKIVPSLCEALEYAHGQGIVHRDIKPENLLMTKSGQVKIADFGLARLAQGEGADAERPAITHTDMVMGTRDYMAPEARLSTKQGDHRMDIYSLGVVFYEMLTGELPIGKFALPSQRVMVDVRLDEVVLRTLEADPARRYQQAGDVGRDVTRIGSEPAPAGARSAAVPPLPPLATVPEGLPWEQPDGLGISGAFRTIGKVLFSPSEAFRSLKPEGSLGRAFLFLMIFSSLGSIAGLCWNVVFHTTSTLLGALSKVGLKIDGLQEASLLGDVAILFLMPILVAIFWVLFSGLNHLGLVMTGASRRGFGTTLRVHAYAQGAVGLFHFVPFLGLVVAYVWVHVCEVVGILRAHSCRTWQAVAAVFWPLLICCCSMGIGLPFWIQKQETISKMRAAKHVLMIETARDRVLGPTVLPPYPLPSGSDHSVLLTVKSLIPGGQGEALGIRAGDLISKYDGEDVTSGRVLLALIHKAEVLGLPVPLEVIRVKGEGQAAHANLLTFTVTPGPLGIELGESANPSDDMKIEKSLPPIPVPAVGAPPRTLVGVMSVLPGSQAETLGILPGDVIATYNGEYATSGQVLHALVRKAAGQGHVTLEVLRGEGEGAHAHVNTRIFTVNPGALGIQLLEIPNLWRDAMPLSQDASPQDASPAEKPEKSR